MGDLQAVIYDDSVITGLIPGDASSPVNGSIQDYIQSVAGGALIPAQYKVKRFYDADLTGGNLLVWQHDLNKQVESIILLDNLGEEFSVRSGVLSQSTIFLDFSSVRPIPGEWVAVVK
jgi:hypothetical protein